ncbi:MAG TPA: hypothetical protein VKA54_09455 [Gemmatimonadaceae bacterium]|nr:hypothetical protein [Gemmatimonadaceae bacterium]
MQLALDRRAIDGECQPCAEGRGPISRPEHCSGHCYRFADTAPESNVQRPDQRDTHQTSPRDAARDTARLRMNLRDVMMGEEIIRPFRGRFYGK